MREDFNIEVKPSWIFHDDSSPEWDVTFWRGNSGHSLPVTFTSKEKAERVAAALMKICRPEHERMLRETQARHAKVRARLDALPKPKSFKPTKKMPRVTAVRCDECEELYREVGPPVYECSRCGQTHVEERRCPDCHIFMAKVDDESRPHCEAALGDERVGVLAVEAPDGQLHQVEA